MCIHLSKSFDLDLRPLTFYITRGSVWTFRHGRSSDFLEIESSSQGLVRSRPPQLFVTVGSREWGCQCTEITTILNLKLINKAFELLDISESERLVVVSLLGLLFGILHASWAMADAKGTVEYFGWTEVMGRYSLAIIRLGRH